MRPPGIPRSTAPRPPALFLLALAVLLPRAAAATEGPALEISGNARYFVDSGGQPFFWQGDTEWELFHLFSVDDARALMEKRQSQGFNVIQVMATGLYPEASTKVGAMKGMKPGDDVRAWLRDDPLSPNEDYFVRMDAIVADAAKFGMILVVGVYHAGDVEKGRINVENARRWAMWLAHRYRNATNIVWSMYPHAEPSSEPVIRETVQGLMEGGGGPRLITIHPDPAPKSSSFMQAESWLSFNTLQTWSTGVSNYDMVSADRARMPTKPVVDGEARYENEDGTTPLEARRPGYWACLAGGFYSYGNRDNWVSPKTWRQWWDNPGARQIQIMGDLFRSLTWWTLVPDPAILAGPSSGNVAARGADGDWILAYLPSPSSVTVDMEKMVAYTRVQASWINPQTGAREPIGQYPNKGVQTFTTPDGWQDAVLLCEKWSN